MDTYDHLQHSIPNSNKSYRMLQHAVEKAEHGLHALVIVNSRKEVMDLNCYIPLTLSRFVTVRCIDSHKDIDWEHWSAPGWENHMLFIDPYIVAQRFPHIAEMLSY